MRKFSQIDPDGILIHLPNVLWGEQAPLQQEFSPSDFTGAIALLESIGADILVFSAINEEAESYLTSLKDS